jgi:hypothetical protein
MNMTPNRVATKLKKAQNIWLVDSSATYHFCGQREWFKSFVLL